MDAQQGFAREDNRTFLHRIHITTKAVGLQVVEERGGELVEAPKIRNILVAEREVLELVDQVIETCEDHIPTLKGVRPIEHIEDNLGVLGI
ncbi:hypothetical protein SDC9_139694 [bioreactor metagenome]|uniref:Uncharacterized protein n=1 Tax=bioreactor metagenome TaxID=1076179 RepID=A0A645DTF1_9ZZZZ